MRLAQNWKLHSGADIWRVHLRNIEVNSMASQLSASPLSHAPAQPGVPHPQAHSTPFICRLEENTPVTAEPTAQLGTGPGLSWCCRADFHTPPQQHKHRAVVQVTSLCISPFLQPASALTELHTHPVTPQSTALCRNLRSCLLEGAGHQQGGKRQLTQKVEKRWGHTGNRTGVG